MFGARRPRAGYGLLGVVLLTAGCAAAAPAASRHALGPVGGQSANPSPVVAATSPAPATSVPADTSAPDPATATPTPTPTVPLGAVPPWGASATVGQAPGTPTPLPAGAVALTFDDGPDPAWTPKILAVLADYHAGAAFFDIGVEARRYPQLVAAEYTAGMGVGNHTWDHPNLASLTPAQIAGEVARAASVIGSATGGHAPSCLRPPYDGINHTTEAVVDGQHETVMIYDVDPRDWSRPGVAAIIDRVLAGARPGAVIDLHDGGGDRSQTVAALPGILQGLARRHLVPVPICRT